jgi:hypothetical protein
MDSVFGVKDPIRIHLFSARVRKNRNRNWKIGIRNRNNGADFAEFNGCWQEIVCVNSTFGCLARYC